jgi:hypothetical protein
MASPPIMTRPPAKVAIIIVNWRNAPDTIACLESLRALEDRDVRIILCDNGSGDGSIDSLTRWAELERAQTGRSFAVLTEDSLAGSMPSEDLTIIASSRNLGFAGGNNLGIRLALADPGIEAFWLLNNDTEVLPDSLAALRARMAEDSRIGLCGSTLVYHHDKMTVQAAAGFYDVWRGGGLEIGQGLALTSLPDRSDVERKMSYPPGASLLASRQFVAQVGLLEESYFLYFEEMDWVLRGRPEFKIGWAPGSVVYHKEGGTIGTHARGRPSDLSLYYSLVNKLRFARRFAPLALPINLARIAAITARFVIRRDFQGARIAMIALGDFVAGRYRTGAWLSASRSK